MAKLQKIGILLSLLFFLSFFAFGYTKIGTSDNSYNIDGRGLFNDNIENYVLYSQTLNHFNFSSAPLVYDYDNDSINEILVADKNTVKIFNFSSENTIFQLEAGFNHFYDIYDMQIYGNYLLTSDYNSDGYLFGVSVYQYNGSEYVFIANHTGDYEAIYDINADNFEYNLAFGCNDNNECVVYYNNVRDLGGANYHGYIYAYSFDMTSTTNYLSHQEIYDNGNSRKTCLARSPNIPYDSSTNCFWSNTLIVSQDMFFSKVCLDGSGSIDSYDYFVKSYGYAPTVPTCGELQDYFTNLIVTDINGFEPKEIIFGWNDNANEFKMYSLELDGTLIDDYPEIFQADGIIISNIIMADIFDDHNQLLKDFCVLGYTSDNRLDLLCASELTAESIFGTGNSAEFKSTINNSFIIDTDNNDLRRTIHSSQHYVNTYNNKDLSEILTPYGVYKITPESNNNFSLIFPINLNEGLLIDSDVEEIGSKDLIYTTTNSINYIDDGFTNSNAEIDGYVINPCLNSVWKQNTTVSVNIVPIDVNGDTVQARAILYYGYINSNVTQDTNWSSFVSSGETIPFSFNADTITSNAVLRLQARDLEHNDSSGDIIDLSFSVNSNGVSFGECSTTIDGLSTPEVVTSTPEEEYTNEDNKLKSGIVNMANSSGIPVLIFIILIIFGVDFVVIVALHNVPILGIIVSIVFDIFMLIIAVLMGLIVEAILISLFAILIILGAITVSRYINSHMGGN